MNTDDDEQEYLPMTEAQYLEADRAREARKDADCAAFGRLSAERAAALERPSELGLAMGGAV